MPFSLKPENQREKAVMQAMKFRSVDFRGGHRTSKAAELQKSVHLLSWMAQPDWTWVGQEAVSKQFHGHLWALLISHLWPGYQISLLHASSCSFQEYCNPHLSRFLYHLSFTIFLLVPVEEKPESSLSLYFFSLSYFLFFFLVFSGKKQNTPPFTGFHISQYTS